MVRLVGSPLPIIWASYDSMSSPLLAKGDSGPIIVDGLGYVGGLLSLASPVLTPPWLPQLLAGRWMLLMYV